jgi:hypothetical protein
MEITVKQISSMHKVRKNDSLNIPEVKQIAALAGQRVSYQLCLTAEKPHFAFVSAKSELPVQVFWLQDAVMDRPVVLDVPMEDYITHEPGLMPDILIPMEEYGWKIWKSIRRGRRSFVRLLAAAAPVMLLSFTSVKSKMFILPFGVRSLMKRSRT